MFDNQSQAMNNFMLCCISNIDMLVPIEKSMTLVRGPCYSNLLIHSIFGQIYDYEPYHVYIYRWKKGGL